MKEIRRGRGEKEMDIPSSKSPGRIPLAIHQLHQNITPLVLLHLDTTVPLLFRLENNPAEPLDQVLWEGGGN